MKLRSLITTVLAGFGIAAFLALPAAAVPSANPAPLTDCFGHNGVQFGTNDAYLCETKLGGNPSGGFYFTKSLDAGVNEVNPSGQMFWTKLHPATGNFYTWENYSMPWGGLPGDSRTNGRIIALDEGEHLGQCIVVWPSWTTTPTECFFVKDGGAIVEPPHLMNAQELASVQQYEINASADMPLIAR